MNPKFSVLHCNFLELDSSLIKNTKMALNKLKQSFRILLKEKRITLINIAGLSISLACALFMLLWVQHELSYDRFHEAGTIGVSFRKHPLPIQ